MLMLPTTEAAADMFVTSSSNAKVLQYDEITGEFLGAFVDRGPPNSQANTYEPTGIEFGSDHNLYLGSFTGNYVKRYDGQTGAYLDTFVTARSGGLIRPFYLAFGPDGNLYLPSQFTNEVKVYDGKTGAYMKSIDDGLWNCSPSATAFSDVGELFVTCPAADSIMSFDPATGQNLSSISLSGVTPVGRVEFGTSGEFYIASRALSGIVRVDADGQWNLFGSTPTVGTVSTVHFGPDGTLYLSEQGASMLVRFDAESGEYLGELVAPGSGGLLTPYDFTFTPRIPGPPVPGDFNGNRLLDLTDIDRLSARVRTGGDINRYDLTGDSQLNQDDRRVWIRDLKKTYVGDANLDSEFNSGDLVMVLAAGEYEDALEHNSGWATGDWDGDGDFTTSDFVTALADGGYEQGPRLAVSTVPEPASFAMLMVGLIGVAIRRRSVGNATACRVQTHGAINSSGSLLVLEIAV
jgi:hypothetical protein